MKNTSAQIIADIPSAIEKLIDEYKDNADPIVVDGYRKADVIRNDLLAKLEQWSRILSTEITRYSSATDAKDFNSDWNNLIASPNKIVSSNSKEDGSVVAKSEAFEFLLREAEVVVYHRSNFLAEEIEKNRKERWLRIEATTVTLLVSMLTYIATTIATNYIGCANGSRTILDGTVKYQPDLVGPVPPLDIECFPKQIVGLSYHASEMIYFIQVESSVEMPLRLVCQLQNGIGCKSGAVPLSIFEDSQFLAEVTLYCDNSNLPIINDPDN